MHNLQPNPSAALLVTHLTEEAITAMSVPQLLRLRQDTPILRCGSNALLLTGHREVKEALEHPDLICTPPRQQGVDQSPELVNLYDRLTNTKAAIEQSALEEAHLHCLHEQGVLLPQIASDVIRQQSPPQSSSDYAALIDRFVFAALCQFTGLPASEAPRYQAMLEGLTIAEQTGDQVTVESVAMFHADLQDWAAATMPEQQGLLAALQHRKLTPEQAADCALGVFVTGIQFTAAALKHLVATLSATPSLPQQLHNDSSTLIQEVLRLTPPQPMLKRAAAKSITLCGIEVEAHTAVFLSLAAANRDPKVFSQPDQLQSRSASSDSLTFHDGTHRCASALLSFNMISALLTQLSADLTQAPAQPEG